MENISNYYQIIFKRLFTISASIFEEYQILLTLEKSNKKNSNEYANHYKYLQELLATEKEVYESLKGQDDIVCGLLKKVAYFNKRAVDFIIPNNNNSLIYTRISLKLNDCLSNIKSKSPEIFALLSKFDILSMQHFETLLLSLILFQKFLKTNPDLVLDDILKTDLYSYSFMFPYIEDIVLKNEFTIPEFLYSAYEWITQKTITKADAITNFKQKKFDQVTTYMKKNNLNALNYIFLLFYLKALSLNLDQKKTKDLEELIKKSGLKKDAYTSLMSFIFTEDSTSLIRKVSFNI